VKKLASLLTIFLIFTSCAACRADTRVETLSWEQVISEDFTGWRVYMGNTSGEYDTFYPNSSNRESSLTLEYNEEMSEPYGMEVEIPVPVGTPYNIYIIVRALDFTGNESDPSNEETKHYFIPIPTTVPTTIPEDIIPPEDPYNLIISTMYWQYRTIILDLT